MSRNALRLLSQLREKRIANSHFLGDKEKLFRLHRILASAYARSEKQAQALAEYMMAFRYARIEPPTLEEEKALSRLRRELDLGEEEEESKENPNRRAAKKKEERENTRREERYRWMKSRFAEEKRLSEEEDSQIQSAGRRFAEEFTRYEELKKEYKKTRAQAALARVKEARGESVSPNRAQLQSERKRLEDLLKARRSSLETLRKGAYKDFIERTRKLYSDTAYEMALSIKRLDLEKYAFRMRSAGSSYLRGRGKQDSLEDKTLRGPSGGLLSALELAHKIAPFHLEYIRLLADEYKRIRKRKGGPFPPLSASRPGFASKKALFFTQLYVYQAQREAEVAKDLGDYALRLAGLHAEKENYSKAIENYEKYFKLEKNEDKKLEVSKRLGDLHYKKGANRERAKELYEGYLQATEEKLEQEKDPKKKSETQALRCETFKALASIARAEGYREREKNYLEGARKEFLLLEKEKEKQEEAIEETQKRVLSLRKQLREKEDESLQNQYYRLKDIALAKQKRDLDWLKSRMKRLNFANILEQMAWLSHNRGLWSEAQNLYSLILEKGSQKQIERSRQNLERIRLSLKDGNVRPPLLSPDFER